MKEKAAFLEGFIKGLSMDVNSDYSKAIKEIASCISYMAEAIDDLEDRTDLIEEDVCDIQDILGDSCDCGDGECHKVTCDKCGSENHLTDDKLNVCNGECKCENCGCELKIDSFKCCDGDCNC